MTSTRREFIRNTVAASALPFIHIMPPAESTYPFPISSNAYNWYTFYGRSGESWGEDWDSCLAAYASTGLKAYEGGFNSADEVGKLAPYLQKYNIGVPSLYVNSTLHTKEDAQKSIENVLAIATAAKKLGTKIVVTNPSPIQWGGDVIKSDEQLEVQVMNLGRLGASLRKMDMRLAYHIHDIELRAGAREFHHMMLNTSPEDVGLCLEVHWIYRGSQNSEVAVFDVLKLYGQRVAEIHIRQSVNGIWSETFGEGDINYPRVVGEIKKIGIRPHLVIEQCVEEKSPNTLNAVQAHIKDLAEVQKTFKTLLM